MRKIENWLFRGDCEDEWGVKKVVEEMMGPRA